MIGFCLHAQIRYIQIYFHLNINFLTLNFYLIYLIFNYLVSHQLI